MPEQLRIIFVYGTQISIWKNKRSTTDIAQRQLSDISLRREWGSDPRDVIIEPAPVHQTRCGFYFYIRGVITDLCLAIPAANPG